MAKEEINRTVFFRKEESKPDQKSLRNMQIFERYVAGEKTRSIAKDFDLTGTRVIQIALEMGAKKRSYEPTPDEIGWMVCKVSGCHTIVRSKWGTLCNKHYFRGRRTGTTADRPKSDPMLTSHGYMAQHWKGHPAASPTGHLYEHRKVFYEAFGPDGHLCKWCCIPVVWGGRGKGRLHVDHLNGNKTDNVPSNLVASCHRCNVNRGLFMAWLASHKDDPVIQSLFFQAMSDHNQAKAASDPIDFARSLGMLL